MRAIVSIFAAGAAATCLLPAIAVAQTFRCTDQNCYYEWRSVGAAGDGPGAFSADACAGDQLWTSHWCYSIAGSGIGGPINAANHGAYALSQPTPDTASQSITDLNSHGLLDAVTTVDVDSTGANAGRATQTLTVTNKSGSPLDLSIYYFADIDYDTDFADDVTLPHSGVDPGGDVRFIVSEPTTNVQCPGCVELWAESPMNWEVSSYDNGFGVNEKIGLGVDLTNVGLPFPSSGVIGDFTGGMQWVLNLAPGGQATMRVVLSNNDVVGGGSGGSVRNRGAALGGAFGVPWIGSSQVPTQGVPLSIDFGGFAPSTTFGFIFLGPSFAQIPICGIWLGVTPVLSSFSVPMSGGNGSFQATVGTPGPGGGGAPCIPSVGPTTTLYWQAFAWDSSAPACIRLVHSDVLETVFGN